MQEFIFCIVPLVFQIFFNAELPLAMNILHSLLETYHILQIFYVYVHILSSNLLYIHTQHFCTYIYSNFKYLSFYQRGFDFHISHSADLSLPFNILHSLLEEFPPQYFYSKFKHIQPCSNSLVMLVNFTIQLLN